MTENQPVHLKHPTPQDWRTVVKYDRRQARKLWRRCQAEEITRIQTIHRIMAKHEWFQIAGPPTPPPPQTEFYRPRAAESPTSAGGGARNTRPGERKP